MHPLAETLLDEPVIAAVKTDEALTAALASPCSAVFLLASTLLTVDGLVHRIHDAGKTGRGSHRPCGRPFVAGDRGGLPQRPMPPGRHHLHPPDPDPPGAPPRPADRPAGIHPGFPLADQPVRSAGAGKPDFVEILPGIMPRVIAEISARTQVPVIAGGLLRDKADVMAAMRAGAAAVSTSAPSLWDI